MQPRQYRPGDVLDDYCPRERRITDHAIVAMVEDDIQRTRCVSCDAEHEFKNAKVPAPRRKAATAALFNQVLDTMDTPARRVVAAAQAETPRADAESPVQAVAAPEPVEMMAAAAEPEPSPAAEPAPAAESEDRPFRRSLIRATLPRPEGQPPPTRAIPEFTMHQPLNQRPRRPGGGGHGRFRRRPGGAQDGGGPMRFGADGGHGNGNGNGAGHGGRRRRRKKQH